MRLPAFDPELIIFDCDGVLVDTERVNNQVMADLVGELGVPMSFAEAVELYIGKSTEDCLRITEARLGRPAPDDLHARWVRLGTRELHARELRAVEGIEGVLSMLARPFCVASNGRHAEIRQNLGLTGAAALVRRADVQLGRRRLAQARASTSSCTRRSLRRRSGALPGDRGYADRRAGRPRCRHDGPRLCRLDPGRTPRCGRRARHHRPHG